MSILYTTKIRLLLVYYCFNLSTLSYGFRNFPRRFSVAKKLFCKQEAEEILIPYQGPTLSYDSMESGCLIENLGLEITVGPSVIAPGRGLFVRINSDVENVTLPMGTPICGYSKGRFTDSDTGDKTVGYCFTSLKTGVFFRQQLLPLIDVISNSDVDDLTYSIQGHVLTYNETKQEIQIFPDPDYTGGNYFIPNNDYDMGPGYYGMFANDMAYHGKDTSYQDYIQSSLQQNILQIVWRMDLIDGVIGPTWPVVIVCKDVLFTNREPMEIGMHYSWRYWDAFRYNSDHLSLRNENE